MAKRTALIINSTVKLDINKKESVFSSAFSRSFDQFYFRGVDRVTFFHEKIYFV